jgi:hypothetical protein
MGGLEEARSHPPPYEIVGQMTRVLRPLHVRHKDDDFKSAQVLKGLRFACGAQQSNHENLYAPVDSSLPWVLQEAPKPDIRRVAVFRLVRLRVGSFDSLKTTTAIAAGVANQAWTLEQLLMAN